MELNSIETIQNPISHFSSLQPLPFALLIKSFCPLIFGHEIVKAGLLLALTSGTKKDHFRSDSHILLVGDPGQGKSQLLQFAKFVADRSVSVTGGQTTTAGLTACVNASEGILEGGAVVMADQGVCCIDEFDKMQQEHLALLEAMEQQCVTITKSGVNCSLMARCSVIAAANPIGGHYRCSL